MIVHGRKKYIYTKQLIKDETYFLMIIRNAAFVVGMNCLKTDVVESKSG